MPSAPTIEKAIRLREAESEIYDLKADTYVGKNADAEWLKDVTAFANAAGGKILIGVREDDDGRAIEAVGISVSELDSHLQTLRQWLKDRTDPDVSGAVKLDIEEDEFGKKFIVVDIEESRFAPHRIIVDSSKMTRQIYVRKGRDSVPIEMAEVREIMMGRYRTLELIEKFVQERRNRRTLEQGLQAGASMLDEHGPKERLVMYHVSPRRGFGSRALVDWALAFENEGTYLGQDKTDWRMTQPNPHGAFSYPTSEPDGTLHQLFYNGAAELVYSDIVYERQGREAIVGSWIKKQLEGPVAHVISVMKQATGCDQFQVDVMIEGTEGLPLIWGSNGQLGSKVVVADDRIYLPSTVVRIGANGMAEPGDLRGILDLVWRAWGEKVCPI